MEDFDLVVLGGGVIGLACLRAIMKRHPRLRAAVVDAPAGAMPASRAAAGMLAPYAEFAEDSPLARACVESLGLYRGFLTELEAEQSTRVTLRDTGTLVPDTATEHERFEARASHYARRGIEYRLIEGDALRKAEPRLAPEISRAIWLPEAVVNSRELHKALCAWTVDRGVRWFESPATRRIEDGVRVNGLELADGIRIRFDRLLAATGAWSNEVATLLDLKFDVQPVKGQMLRVAAPDGYINNVIHLKELYLAPRPGQGIIIGSTMEEKGFDFSIDPAVVRDFVARADALVPGIAQFAVAEEWAGLRPRSSDGMPIIGWAPRWQNVLVATGHFRNGILLTPLTGEIVAGLYDQPLRSNWREFSPSRFETAR